jgi:hypothetical protein
MNVLITYPIAMRNVDNFILKLIPLFLIKMMLGTANRTENKNDADEVIVTSKGLTSYSFNVISFFKNYF